MGNKLPLTFGIFIISWSSILIRWMGAIDPLIIAFYRLAFSAMVLLPFAMRRQPSKTPVANRVFWLIPLAGIFLALHFYTWITSLQLTTVGNSIFLESTHPLFAYILSVFFLKEKAGKSMIPAFILGLIGMYLMLSENITQHSGALAGDSLAIFSAFCIAAYLLIARKSKQDLPLLRYLFYVYGSAALLLLGPLLWNGVDFWELPVMVWVLLIILALGPNLIGHSLLNRASRHMPVYLVNMALLSESVLATAYAAILLDEIPVLWFYLGALFILYAIFMVFKRETISISEV